MKVVIISQARMTSTRLPGKVLKKVLGKPLLEYQIERLRRVKLADEIVIATTVNDTDQPVVDLCQKLDVHCYRGSEDDVLSRYYEAAREYEADVVVRVTSDCPLIDPAVVDKAINHYMENDDEYDYVSNTLQRTYPRGMDTEVFSFKALQEANHLGVLKPEREHVTLYLYNNPRQFRLGNVEYGRDCSEHRWTVDTPEDFALIKNIIEGIYPDNTNFTLEDVLAHMVSFPDLKNLNKQIKQKVC